MKHQIIVQFESTSDTADSMYQALVAVSKAMADVVLGSELAVESGFNTLSTVRED